MGSIPVGLKGLLTTQKQVVEQIDRTGKDSEKDDTALWYSILHNTRRRYMLEHLKSCNGILTLDVLVEHLIEIERGDSSAKNLKRSIKISIIQTHLPLLERAGIVSFNPHTKEIRLIKIPEDVAVHMSLLHRADISYEMYYIAVSLVGIAGAAVVSEWVAIIALVGICIGAIVQKKGKLLLKGETHGDN